jgi:hypothetical protein
MSVPWATIVDTAARLAPHVIGLAEAIARHLTASGCQIEGCPHDVRAHLIQTPITAEDESVFAARAEAAARVRGLDQTSVRGLLRRDDVHLLRDGAPLCGRAGLFTTDRTRMTCPRCADGLASEVYGG